MEQVKKNPGEGFTKWFRDMKAELKKVAWPTYKQVQKNTIIVLVYIAIVGAFLASLDVLFAFLMGLVMK